MTSRYVLIALLFFIDVRVRAEDDCWSKHVPCSVNAAHGKREIKSEDLELVLSGGSLLHQRDARVFQLVSGELYVDARREFTLKTPYAEVSCGGDCKAIFIRKSEEITVKVLDGSWRVHRTGEKKDYRLSAGLQLSIGEVEVNGMARMEIPQSLPWDTTIREWSKLYPHSVDAFKSDVRRFRHDWREATAAVSREQEALAGREIASFEAGLARRRARAKAEATENERLRQMLREKNYLD